MNSQVKYAWWDVDLTVMEETQRGGPALQLRVGDVIAERYKIEKLLGTGGTGTVYLALDTFLENQPIAIKMLHPHLNREEKHTKRFVREVLLTRQVTHPNVVRTFDVATQDDNLFYTMEYVSGKSLTKALQNGPLPLREGVGILTEICKGLAAIHDAGIIHRDLKPGNVILTDNNEIKISDFGIARHEEHSVTTSSEVVGSSHYIAPEVWRGEVNAPTVDIYSLGVLAYDVFTGVRMFAGETIHELMYKHCQTLPTAPLLVNEEIPVWLNDIILAMVEKKPSLRPQSARQIGLTIEEEYQAECSHHTQRIAVSSLMRLEAKESSAASSFEILDPLDPVSEELSSSAYNSDALITQNAGEELLKSWSTRQEKLNAIQYLQSVGTAESVEYLIRAVERYHPDDIDLAPMTEWPKTGEIAAKAACALGASGNENAVSYLIELLNDKRKPDSLREAASYGLSATSSDEVLLTLRRAFQEERGAFQRSVLFAIREALQPLGKTKRDSVVQVVLMLVAYATEHQESESALRNELLLVSCEVIRTHLSPGVEEELLSIATTSDNLPKCIQAVALLREAATPKIHRGLVELLRDEVLPEQFSLAIGNTLKDSQNALVRKVAQEIIEHQNVVQSLFSSLSMSKHKKIRMRRIAAKMILGQDLSAEELQST